MIIQDNKEYNNVCHHIKTNNNTAVYAYKGGSYGYHMNGAGCHGSTFPIWKSSSKLDYFASCAALEKGKPLHYGGTPVEDYLMTDDICQEYLRWLFSPESSWAKIHLNDVELIEDDKGRIRGFILGPKALNVPKRAGLLNLCIAARMTRDKIFLFKNMIHLREIGLDLVDAFFLCGYLAYTPITKSWSPAPYAWSGSHEPLKARWGIQPLDKNGYVRYDAPFEEWIDAWGLDYVKFRKSDYTPKSVDYHTEGWGLQLNGKPDPVQMVDKSSKTMKTKFSQIKLTDISSILALVDILHKEYESDLTN